MILEGLCTTLNPDGTTNIAPMGPIVDLELNSFLFRPFQTSTTFKNLQRERAGVFHITDDVGLIAKTAVGKLDEIPGLIPTASVSGKVIASVCRWYEFEVTSLDDSQPRSEIQTRVIHTGHLRDFIGLNRAKHAVLETAILATRLHILSRTEIEHDLKHFKIIVEKTAGPDEREAFAFLVNHIQSYWTSQGK